MTSSIHDPPNHNTRLNAVGFQQLLLSSQWSLQRFVQIPELKSIFKFIKCCTSIYLILQQARGLQVQSRADACTQQGICEFQLRMSSLPIWPEQIVPGD